MVAMARALMGRPKLICMDEPTMGLSPLYVDRVLELIAHDQPEGVTVFMVEQNASLALEIAHDGLCAADRPDRAAGSARTLLADPRIRDAYLGGSRGGVRAVRRRRACPTNRLRSRRDSGTGRPLGCDVIIL